MKRTNKNMICTMEKNDCRLSMVVRVNCFDGMKNEHDEDSYFFLRNSLTYAISEAFLCSSSLRKTELE